MPDSPSPGMLAHSALSREGRGRLRRDISARLPSPLAGEGSRRRRVDEGEIETQNGYWMDQLIFKICDHAEWAAAEQAGVYHGSDHDLADGFIHFSTASQLPGTLAKHYTGRDGLVLIAFDAAAFGDELKWEPARGGELFPHLYAPLKTGLALWTTPLPLDEQGVHILPPEISP